MARLVIGNAHEQFISLLLSDNSLEEYYKYNLKPEMFGPCEDLMKRIIEFADKHDGELPTVDTAECWVDYTTFEHCNTINDPEILARQLQVDYFYSHDFNKMLNKTLDNIHLDPEEAMREIAQFCIENKDIVFGKEDPWTFSSGLDYSNNNKTPEYLIDGLLYEGCITQIIAAPKVGKTTLTYVLLQQAIYEGVVFNEHRVNKPIKPMYFCYEGSLGPMTEAFKDIDGKILILNQNQDAYIDEGNNLKRMFNIAEEKGCNVIVIDPINKALAHTDRGKESELLPILREMEKLALEKNISVIITNHSNRMNDAYTTTVNNVSGSEVTNRVSSASIILRRARKTEEEEQENYNLSKDELNSKPISAILVKENYRYGNTGYTQFKVDIDVKRGVVNSSRYIETAVLNTKGETKKRLDPKDRLNQLIGLAKLELEVGQEFNKGELATILARLTSNREDDGISEISKKKINDNYITDIVNKLTEEGYLIRIPNRKFRFINPKEEDVF